MDGKFQNQDGKAEQIFIVGKFKVHLNFGKTMVFPEYLVNIKIANLFQYTQELFYIRIKTHPVDVIICSFNLYNARITASSNQYLLKHC